MYKRQGLGFGNVSFQAVALLNGAFSLPLADYFIEENMLVQSYRGDGRWCHFNPYLSVTWTPAQCLNLQLTGGWLYNRYNADASEASGGRGMTLTSACWTAEARVNWYVGAFVFSGFMTAPQKTAGYDLRTTRTIWDFGLTAGWSYRALRLEGTIRNPFLRHPVYTHTLMSPVYSSRVTQFSPSDRQSLAIKAAYTLDFGKKTSHDNPAVDRSVSSALLRAQ